MKAFWFAPESPRPLALMRIILAAALLWETLSRWPYVVELYSTAGFPFPAFPRAFFQPVPLDAFRTVTLHSLLVIALVLVLVGWHARLSLLLAFVLTGYFALLDAAGTLTKYTAISLHLCLLLSFAQPGGVWSVDAWIHRRRNQAVPLASAWPRRLMQLLVASIYLGAAVTKIRLPDFATGDLLEFSLLDDAFGGRDLGLWLATKPRLLILGSFAVLVFEVLFPALIWIPRLRRWVLASAVLFHVGLAVLMHLATFSPIMLAALCAFLTEADLKAVFGQLKSFFFSPNRPTQASFLAIPENSQRKRVGWLNSAAFGVTILTALAVMVGLHPARQADGPFHQAVVEPFPPVDAEQAHAMIDAYPPPYRDYFHRIELGSRLGYRRVYGERDRFAPGQVVFVMARLLQPHPTLELEWELVAPTESNENPPASARYQRRLDASHSYASIGFQLQPDFPAGRYVIRLTAGEAFGPREVVSELPFELAPED